MIDTSKLRIFLKPPLTTKELFEKLIKERS